ncbi:MAG: C40 family peptidase [Lachnospiraceae bacterium]|nr:C40 family peptidase [Lachnospiraceae bacterium]
MNIIENYVQYMEKIAADQSHGYSQQSRWGPDYDCSSLVITALEQAGIPAKTKGATYTGNMRSVLLALGFRDVIRKVDRATGKYMERGDILLNEIHHTAVYCGNGKIVHARGQSYGSQATGDQGQEIAITNYYNYPWDCVLRYTGSSQTEETKEKTQEEYYVGQCYVCLGEMVQGCIGQQVKTVQILLNKKGFRGKDGKTLDEDGEYGPNTAYAVETLQRQAGMQGIYFGTVSSSTWRLLLS